MSLSGGNREGPGSIFGEFSEEREQWQGVWILGDKKVRNKFLEMKNIITFASRQ
jgi:hypothetical protein